MVNMNDIFDKVWSEKYRPKSIDEMVLSDETKKFFSGKTEIPNLLFYGKPGTGKTTLAKILVNELAPYSYLYINASETNGIDMIRNDIKSFVSTKSMDGGKKIVILDEADGLSSAISGTGSSAQGALRNIMEESLDNVRFILTANYLNKITRPIQSRCTHFELTYDIKDVIKTMLRILKNENIPFVKEQLDGLKKLVKETYPDIRKCINRLQYCCSSGNFEYLQKKEDEEFASLIFEQICEEGISVESLSFKIRKLVLDNEDLFGNDYHMLMRQLFNVYVKNKQSAKSILYIADAMEKHNIVMDYEVNFFALIIRLVMEKKA